ncbi:integral membrane protein mpv17 pmp22 family [Zychaea mexicana]|uniref:integral membrane protein mpv17 pmp22 family n=1 Tax=Zychaea mexicana TaxID=64656 RepID=UPI0022FDBD57|nr:integral membrane protein mpv17 pmp22 family [Zychaea mexicana]KAI9497862.1 integral membrane protein mpv17 pmp22 family [Zychaea mexicana]
MFTWYSRALSRRPILVQCITTAFLFGTGDVIAQQAVEKRGFEHHEVSRTLRMAGFGGAVAGPVLSTWYRFIELNVKGSTPLNALVKKVAADQLLCAPIFIAGFFSAQGLLEGKSIAQIQEKLENGYTTAVLANYKIWPAVQFVNFYFTPLNHRLMVSNVISLGWNAYLSYMNQQSSSAPSSSDAHLEVQSSSTAPVEELKQVA